MKASQIVAALAVALPLVSFAQTPAAEPAKPAEGAAPAAPAAAAPAAPAAEPAKPAPAPEKKPEEGIKVQWYGFVLANAYFDGGTFVTKDYPGAAARDPQGAGGATLFSARQTRFGIRLSTKDVNWTGAELSANAEFDFKGGNLPGAITCTPVPDTGGTPTCTTAAASTSWNVNLLRMRIATATAKWTTGAGSIAFMAGQAPGLVNTLFAESVAWVADPIFWQAGNVWRRVPQLRLSYGNTFGPVALSLEAAALSGTDAPPAGSVPGGSFDYGAANRSRMPELEGRIALTLKPMPDLSIMVGGAINQSKRTYDTNANKADLTAKTMGVEADIQHKYVQVKGEYYKSEGGEDAYNGFTATVTGAAGSRALVNSSGYWAQAILKPIPELWVYGGIGKGTGDEDDLALVTGAARGTAAFGSGTRAENQQTAAGAIINFGKALRFGLEYVMVKTTWIGVATTDPVTEVEANQFAFSTQFRY